MKQVQNRAYMLNDGTTVFFDYKKLKAAIVNLKKKYENDGKRCSIENILEEIADKVGVSASAIKHWCAGHHTPSDFEKIRDISYALNIDINSLVEMRSGNLNECNVAGKKSLEEIWYSVKNAMHGKLTETAINTWFRDCEPVFITDSVFVLHTSSSFIRDVLEQRYCLKIRDIMNELFCWHGRVKVTTMQSGVEGCL